MNNFFKLVWVFINGSEPSANEKKRSKWFYRIMGGLIVLCIMVPAAAIVGYITYALTIAMTVSGGNTQGLQAILSLISVFSFIFGLNVIFSVFYFSADLQHLLPLPISPVQLIGSKFVYAMISENIMQFILVAGAFVGYGAAEGSGASFVNIALTGVAVTATLPIVPLVYCGIICLLVMYAAAPFAKNLGTVAKVTSAAVPLAVAGIIFAAGSAGGFDPNNMVTDLLYGSTPLISAAKAVFPSIAVLSSCGILELLAYLGINIVYAAVFLLLAKSLYFKGLQGAAGGGASAVKQKAKKVQRFAKRQLSPFTSYLKKEFAVLFKTPAYFLNCIAVNILFPVIVCLVILFDIQTGFLNQGIMAYRTGDKGAYYAVTIGVMVLSVLVTALNTIASSGITREGSHFDFMKYIPVPIKIQLEVKVAVSEIISFCGMAVCVVAACLYLQASWYMTANYLALSFFSVVFMSYMGVYMDTINPKLIWEDEINALRGNYNVFINMAVAIFVCVLTAAGSYFLFMVQNISFTLLTVLIMLELFALAIVFYFLCTKKGVKNLSKLS